MSLSQNIKKLRLRKNLTQEQLAAALGISAQAVSKWETSDTYPDGSLLVPLANELNVSLDKLFGNEVVTMEDIADKVLRLMRATDEKQRFEVARDIGWQIEKGLFNCRMLIEEGYDPEEIKELQNSSYVLNDYGFTLISNGRAPFFSVFCEPEEGYGEIIGDGEEMRRICECLAQPETMKAVLFVLQKERDFTFDKGFLAGECQIGENMIDTVINHLIELHLVSRVELQIDGENCILHATRPSHKRMALFLMAHELNYRGAYSLQSEHRQKPYI